MKTIFLTVTTCFFCLNYAFTQASADGKTRTDFGCIANYTKPITPDKWVATNLTPLMANCITATQHATIYKTYPLWIDPKEKIARFDGFKIVTQTSLNDEEVMLIKSIICDSNSYIRKADLVKFCLFTPTLGIELLDIGIKKPLNILLARSCSMIQFHLDSTVILLHCDPSTPRFEPFFDKLEKMAAIAAANGTANILPDSALLSAKAVEKNVIEMPTTPKPPLLPAISHKVHLTEFETVYEVVRGDNLTSIARKLANIYHITVVSGDLLRWNGAIRSNKRKNSNDITVFPGQKLAINIEELYKLSINPY
ncbi:MAG: hypothetical protein RI894_1726 [Bacteroidota bacterium]|jgi:hypothetical protein